MEFEGIEVHPDLLEARIENVKARFPGFTGFDSEVWENEERRYKGELREIFRERLADAAELAPEVVARRLLEVLGTKLPSTGRHQNLVGWRYVRGYESIVENLERAARVGTALQRVLAAEEPLAEEIAAFSATLFEYASDSGLARSLPTLVAMLVAPEREILLRTDDVNDAARFLLDRPLVREERRPLDVETYRRVREFARFLHEELARRGLAPRDLEDIQGFLWASRDVPVAWIFQASPRGPMDVPRALAEGLRVIYWSVPQHADKVREGDAAFIWMAGPEGGLLATARVASSPGPREEIPPEAIEAEAPYWRENRTKGGGLRAASVVRVEIERAFPGDPVPRKQLQEDPVLRHLMLFRNPQGTVFPVSPVARQRLEALAATRKHEEASGTAASPVAAAPVGVPRPAFSEIREVLAEAGLVFGDEQVATFLLALEAKRFVILSGISGTGKTRLALEVAKLHSPPGERRWEVIPVRPDWTDGRPLLGYLNPLSGSYVTTPFLRLLLSASREEHAAGSEKRPPAPFFAILDEMNLARVEHYFADVLSAMESGEPIPLHDDEKVERDQDIPRAVAMPRNLFVVGTVNVDETTFMFSPKVLDRAFTLELDDVFLDGDDLPRDEGWELPGFLGLSGHWAPPSRDDWEALGEIADGDLLRFVVDLHRELRSFRRHFGYRVANEIARFVVLACRAAERDEDVAWQALDIAVRAKVLPKFHGTREELEESLLAVVKMARLGVAAGAFDDEEAIAERETAPSLPRTWEKGRRMLDDLQARGFTSFIE